MFSNTLKHRQSVDEKDANDPFDSNVRYAAQIIEFRDSFLNMLFELNDGLDVETLFVWMTDVQFENGTKFLSSIIPLKNLILKDEENERIYNKFNQRTLFQC